MSQLTYSQDMALGQAGQIADASTRVIDSFAAEGAIPFGRAVARGTDPAKQVIPFLGTGFVGVAIFSHTEVTGQFEDESTVAVMTSGRVIVDTLAVDVTAGETAYAVNATGVYTNVATDATAVGTWITSGTGLQVLELA